MSERKNFNRKTNYYNKNQIAFKVLGYGTQVAIVKAKLDAGMTYEERLKVLKSMDKKASSLGAKILASGYWTLDPLPSDGVPELSVDDEGLPIHLS